MTTLYSQRTYEPVGNMSEAAAYLAVVRWPSRYFYYVEDQNTVRAEDCDPSWLKPGGTC